MWYINQQGTLVYKFTQYITMSSTFDVSSMNESYPELSKLLNDHVKVKVFEAYKDRPDELEEAEDLISDLERLGCKEIEKKLNEKEADNFDSTVSELKVAKVLLDNKHNVEFLSEKDPCFKKRKGQTYKSPDIICKDNDSTTCVEVVRLNDSSRKDIVDLIQDQVGDFVRCLPYRIDVHLKEELSLPKIKKEDKNKQKQSVLDSLEIFKKSFSEDMQPQVPLNLPNDAGDFTFVLKKNALEQGYLCIISICFDIPAELIKYLEKYDIDKKDKAHDFPIEQRNNPFIIAIDLRMWEIKDEDIHSLLYGLVGLHPRGMKKYWEEVMAEVHSRDSWEKIKRAQSNGWDSFLREKFLIPNNETLLCINKDNEGKFVSDKMEDISAILVIDHNNKCFFYPNPFCRDEINNPKIVNFINTNENVQVQNKLPWMK